MIRSSISIPVIFAGVLLGSTAFAGDLSSEVEAAYDAYDAAFNKADLTAFMASFTPNARVHAPGGRPKSGKDIEARYAGLFEAGVTDHKIALVDAYDSGELVIAIGRWAARKPGEDGALSELGGNALHVFERQPDGRLEIRELIFN